MSYSNRFSGAITITPPLTAAEIRTAPEGASAAWDAHLRIDRREIATDEGEAVIYTADAIVGPEEACNGYDVEEQIKTLVALFADGHEFAGFIQEDPDPGFDEPPHRWVVRGREAVHLAGRRGVMPETWTVTHPATGVTLGTTPLLRDAKTVAVDAYKQYAVFDGDTECYAYTYHRDRATGHLRQVAHDDERGWFTGVEIAHVRTPAAEARCEQCGRVGTRGFRTFPDADAIHDGRVAVAAHSMTECANRDACRRRWPKPPMGEDQ